MSTLTQTLAELALGKDAIQIEFALPVQRARSVELLAQLLQ
jgi:hypothetical protein